AEQLDEVERKQERTVQIDFESGERFEVQRLFREELPEGAALGRVVAGEGDAATQVPDGAHRVVHAGDVEERGDLPYAAPFAPHELGGHAVQGQFRRRQGFGAEFVFQSVDLNVLQAPVLVAQFEI